MAPSCSRASAVRCIRLRWTNSPDAALPSAAHARAGNWNMRRLASAASACIPERAANARAREASRVAPARRRPANRLRRPPAGTATASVLRSDVGDFVISVPTGCSRISWPSSSTTRTRRSRTSCAAPTCWRRRHGRSGCSNNCGLPTPSYLHHPIAVDAHGEKLSKQTARRRCPQSAAGAYVGVAVPRAARAAAGPATVAEFWRWAHRAWNPARLSAGSRAAGTAAHDTL